MKYLSLVSLLILSAYGIQAFAQEDVLKEADSILNSDQIDVDGQWSAAEEDELSNTELIEEARKKSEKKNVKMLAKQIENLQIPREQVREIKDSEKKNLQEKISNVFGSGSAGDGSAISSDQVSVRQAAVTPVAPIETIAPALVVTESPLKKAVIEDENTETQFKIIPAFGVLNIKGDQVNYESKINISLSAESMVNSRLSLGVGLTYSTLDISDDNNNYESYVYDNYGYYDIYGDNGRQLNYNHFAVDMNSKVFIINSGKIRPYLGAALAYNRTSLSFSDKRPYYDQYGIRYGNEQFTSSYVSARGSLGSEIKFSNSIGLNLDVSYAKGLAQGFDYESTAVDQNFDQQRLNQLGREIEDAGFMTISGGLLVTF
ncbi:MAG: hypothetical protein A2504_17690 [Bdellovibrionales bacterium RIFOXYD12_FULL_39_22]|nr:MAG: hypothetical protein A2385_15390 [Bdellovibrionales bacterium RIFOXYB1_FULL_39_21]OFZ40608.1 MAG: hypothetical protein A2485_03375 [Bdellovibrionales bacterium RIFOXYC12_FULL_39_17]OFZ50444.1 MAG: hypothetical protein A2404_02690 [Bdellovibrionales bacterium RIFOXYC1_FULL_39_130]OFZ68116.1 MAG: hypothetical protein A2451_00025 [Bdellovibrionales bacterium RIFOXYC2_FULL_39_8]OFZ77703.1 MAG: hypothetical protein A2560_05060 [Bdellovibrionales bacterium RIFOXYD1_FULL_39_84]OFZ91737.1 MAG: